MSFAFLVGKANCLGPFKEAKAAAKAKERKNSLIIRKSSRLVTLFIHLLNLYLIY
jgi:hypothetical protein